MLVECMTFHDKKMPDPNIILKPKKSNINKAQPIYNTQKSKKLSTINIEDLEEEETLHLMKNQEEITLAEKIIKRKQEEQENKKKEVLKKLNKPKNIDINKFLTRSVVYEQKKNFDLEQKRFNNLDEEAKLCQDKPLLSHKTEEMCKTLYKKPIYERTKEIIKNREKKIDDLKKDEYNVNKKLRNKKNKKANNIMYKINQNE